MNAFNAREHVLDVLVDVLSVDFGAGGGRRRRRRDVDVVVVVEAHRSHLRLLLFGDAGRFGVVELEALAFETAAGSQFHNLAFAGGLGDVVVPELLEWFAFLGSG